MADITTVRAKILDALNEELRLVNQAAATLKTKLQDALDEADLVISPPSPSISTTLTFTEGVASSIDVSSLLPTDADRYHMTREVQKDGFYTDNSVFNWLPGVAFDPATKHVTYDGSPLSLNANALTPNTGYFLGAEKGAYNTQWQYPPTYSTPPGYAVVGGLNTSQSIYGGSKHTRAVVCPKDGMAYIFGGDYGTYNIGETINGQDGRMVMWRVNPTTQAWALDYPVKGRTSDAVPLQSDRMNMDWDPTRQFFWVSHGSVRPGPTGYIGNAVPAGYTGDVRLYYKGNGGLATAYPEGANDNDMPVFIYRPSAAPDPNTGQSSFKLARNSTPLLTPWVQSNAVMMGTCYHDASKRWYGIGKGTKGVVVYYLDTTNWETNPDSLAWQTLQVDLTLTGPNNLTGVDRSNIYGPPNSLFLCDDTAKVAYFLDVTDKPALLALTLPGHPQGEHRVITVADLKAALGNDFVTGQPWYCATGTKTRFTGITALTLDPFVWIPEHRCVLWLHEPDEENVGPWTYSLQINVDTGTVVQGPRFPNNEIDGKPRFPNCGFWYPPTDELVLFGGSIMTHNVDNGGRSWDGNDQYGIMNNAKSWARYKWNAAGTSVAGQPWTFVGLTVVMQSATAPTPQTITSFSADRTSITQGDVVTLTWATANATAVRLNGVAVATGGTQTVSPTTSTTYVLEADGSAATVSQSIAITVAQQPPVDPGTVQGTLRLVGSNVLQDLNPAIPGFVLNGSMGFAGIVSNGSHADAPNMGPKGSLVLFGGGHNDYGGNECCAFDFNTEVWTRLSAPSTSATSTTDPNIDWTHGELPDGSAMACHGFNVITVIPGGTNGKGLMMRIAAPSLGISGGAPSAPWVHVADLGVTPIAAPTTIWSRYSLNACTMNTYASSPVPSFHTYDVSAGVIWGGYAGGFHTLLTKFNLATRTYTMVTTASSNWGFMPVACAHPVRGLLLYVSTYGGYQQPQTIGLNAIDLANPSTGRIALQTQGDTIPVAKITALGGYMNPWAIDWDTTNDVGYITTGDDEPGYVYRVQAPTTGDVKTGKWTITKQAIPTFPALAGANGGATLDSIYGHWRYHPAIKAFSFLGNTKTKLALWYP